MKNEKEVITYVTLLAGALRQETTAPMLEGFCLALKDLTEPELRQAVARALTDCKFFPSPAELRAFAGRKRLEAPYHAPAKLSPDLGKWTRGELPGDWRVPKRLCAMVDEAKGVG